MELKDTRHKCPVCGKHDFSEVDSFEYCSVCGWGDDMLQEQKPDFEGGFNRMSLNQAKKAYEAGQPIE